MQSSRQVLNEKGCACKAAVQEQVGSDSATCMPPKSKCSTRRAHLLGCCSRVGGIRQLGDVST
eukprot:1138382-Pelagomonas_calceolata.AAC.4